VAMVVQLFFWLSVFIQPTGGGPVPPGLGGHPAPGKSRDVAGLAGEFVYVVVQFWLVVGRKAMAGLATGPGEIRMARHINAQGIPGIGLVPAAGYRMPHGGVAVRTAEIQALRRHVHIQ